MSTFSFYDLATGEFVGGRTYSGSAEFVEVNTPAGMGAVEGNHDYLAQKVDITTGEVVDHQPDVPAPTDFIVHEWDADTKRWVPTLTLAGLRDKAWSRIKDAREAAFDAPLLTPYGIFDSYADARINIAQAAQLAQTLAGMGQPVAIDYTLADNSIVTLDLVKMVTVGLMLGAKVQGARATATALRTRIENASLEELDSITWPT